MDSSERDESEGECGFVEERSRHMYTHACYVINERALVLGVLEKIMNKHDQYAADNPLKCEFANVHLPHDHAPHNRHQNNELVHNNYSVPKFSA